MADKKKQNKIKIMLCIFVFIVCVVICFKGILPKCFPNNGRVMITESGTKITMFGTERCAIELSDGSAAMYEAAQSTDGLYQQFMLFRGEMPEEIIFQDMCLGEDKVKRTITMMHEMKLSDCFKTFSNMIGVPIDTAKTMLQAYGTVFEVSQETHPEIMKDGVRFGLDLQDSDNNTAVLAYADEKGNIDSVQFTVCSESGGKIADKFLNISKIEKHNKKPSKFAFSKKNTFFNDTEEYVDVLYLKDGTLTIKYDISLGNYVIFEFRTYGSMNQGFHGAFKTDKENVYADTIETIKTDGNVIDTMAIGSNVNAVLYSSGKMVISGNGAIDKEISTYDYAWNKYRDVITEIVIEEGVVYIPPEAFVRCSKLESVVIPETVTSLENTFIDCPSLKEVSVPDGVSNKGAFARCTALEVVRIGDNVAEIGNSSFQDCSSLTTIYIPDSITSVYHNAFLGCDNLKNVYFNGTKIQWENITIEEGNHCLVNAKIHFTMP